MSARFLAGFVFGSSVRMSRYSIYMERRLEHRAQKLAWPFERPGAGRTDKAEPPKGNERAKATSRRRNSSVNRAKMQVSTTRRRHRDRRHAQRYGDFHVLKDINLKVMAASASWVCGPSGSGKSTMIPLHQPLESNQEGTNNRRRHRTHQRSPRRSTRCGARSAWCSSTSTSSRI